MRFTKESIFKQILEITSYFPKSNTVEEVVPQYNSIVFFPHVIHEHPC